MSNTPEKDLDLNLHFLPDWAKQSSDTKDYSKYSGEEGTRRPRRGSGPPRERRGPRRDGPPSGRSGGSGGGRPPREGGGRRPGRPGQGGRRGPQDRDRGYRPPAPLPELKVSFVADEKGVDSLTRQIKMTGRAFPLFEIGRMILARSERYSVAFHTMKNAEGQIPQRMFVCALDDTLWLSEDDAIRHVLKNHFDTFYQAEKIATEPPKGTYTFVAQCGMSGRILGPPNHHDYQNRLHQLHRERFSRMGFEDFKARIRIVRDEEVVKQWVEEQSWTTEYICLNLPEAQKLTSREEVETHFRETHRETIIKEVETHKLAGNSVQNCPNPQIQRLVRSALEEQRRFPLKLVHVLSQQFASRGLQFFKVNKSVTHVSVARPHYLDLDANPISTGIRQIVEYVDAHPKCNRKVLIEALAPTPPPAAPAASPEAPKKPESPGAESAEGAPTAETAEGAPTAAPEGTKAEAPAAEGVAAAPTPEQQALITDLHWLVHQGHVIEFANGILETAKKPVQKPQAAPKKAKKPAAAEAGTGEVPSAAADKDSNAVVKDDVSAQAAPAGEKPTETGQADPDPKGTDPNPTPVAAESVEPTTPEKPPIESIDGPAAEEKPQVIPEAPVDTPAPEPKPEAVQSPESPATPAVESETEPKAETDEEKPDSPAPTA